MRQLQQSQSQVQQVRIVAVGMRMVARGRVNVMLILQRLQQAKHHSREGWRGQKSGLQVQQPQVIIYSLLVGVVKSYNLNVHVQTRQQRI